MRWMGDTLGQGPPGKPLHSGPPPPVKGRMVRGVWNSISAVDESAGASAV
jgi:hypothetical protein